jgi:hypothetical protein
MMARDYYSHPIRRADTQRGKAVVTGMKKPRRNEPGLCWSEFLPAIPPDWASS